MSTSARRQPTAPQPQVYSPQELGEAALRGFFMLADAWGLNTAEQITLLGGPSRSAFFAWKKAPAVAISGDTMERISYLLGIWKALRILIPDDRQALAWVKKPNLHPMFGGNPPLERMLRGRLLDLADVRRMLDGRRGGW